MNKQSNERFNDLINYIEDNLCEEISYKKLAQILGVNEYTMHIIFLSREESLHISHSSSSDKLLHIEHLLIFCFTFH
jgi:hypothetical protein